MKKSGSVKSKGLKRRIETRVLTLDKDGLWSWGIYRGLGWWKGASWSREQVETNGSQFGVELTKIGV
jgi:hypothetical protein